ncbi:MAG: AgmX/PglI C-terminal domain-containing protein [Deltaproteobacteria bacterium]|nr:AgmX/PglI C-terminal domain-containing protein [Deltaproteobacteria bacterium]
MERRLALLVLAITCLACGPQPRGPEPVEGPGPEPQPADPEPQLADPEPAEPEPAEPEPAKPEPPPAGGPQSASETEVKPMSVKDFDVSTEVDFSPSPAKEKKAAAIEKIGMATASTTDCYIKLLEKQAELQGKIEISFTINPAGVPKKVAAVSNTTGSSDLEKCAVKNFKSKKFPKKLAGKKPVKTVVSITLLPYK